MYMTKKLTLAAAIATALTAMSGVANVAQAQEAVHAISYNAAITTDYRYRGVSQTRLKPALQAGADYVHNPSGFYVGTWGSTIKWVKDSGGDSDVELDFYGGKRGELTNGVTYDVGGLYYLYPSNKLAVSANTFEVYGAIGYGPLSLKYSHSTTDLFGATDSKGSGYWDASFNQEVTQGYVLNLHLGRQTVKKNSNLSYFDWKVGVTKDFGPATVSLAVISSDLENAIYGGKNIAKTGAVLTVSKTF